MILCQTLTGQIHVESASCCSCEAKPCIAACPEGILGLLDGVPSLIKDPGLVRKGLCRECLACELACTLDGRQGLTILLPIEGLDS